MNELSLSENVYVKTYIKAMNEKYIKQFFLLMVAIYLPRTQTSLSLDENVRAKEGGKETTGETALRLRSVPFPRSLAVHHQSLASHGLVKNEAPEGEAGHLQLFGDTKPAQGYLISELSDR